jgi:sterol desaturase/sphingolipid hydroxylase (fatty acid hydroxylase superfamily)
MNSLVTWYSNIQEWMMQNIVLPTLYATNGMGHADDAVTGLDWFLLGLIQVIVIALVFKPIENLIPAEDATKHSKKNLQISDVFYTLIHRLGIFKLVLFFAFADVFFWFEAQLHDVGYKQLNVENWIPGITSIPLISFLIYLVIIDFFEYAYHRSSHKLNWWWQLHALHHSQQYMTVWSDNRNHVLDDLMHAAFFALLALMIGVEPIQFLWIIALGQLVQSWQHGNLNLDHGWFKYVLISPKFHRLHHAVGMGHEVEGRPGVLGGCNFGVLFPWWDMALGTARFSQEVHPTGVRGLTVSNNPLRHQWHGLVHSFKSLLSK